MTAIIENTLLHSRLQPADPGDHALLLNAGADVAAWHSLRGEPEPVLSQIQRQVSARRERGQSVEGIGCEIRLRTEIDSGGHSHAKVVIPLDQLDKGKLRAGMQQLWETFGAGIRQVCESRGIVLGGLDEAFVKQFEAAPRLAARAARPLSRPRSPRGNARKTGASPRGAAGCETISKARLPLPRTAAGSCLPAPRRKATRRLAGWAAGKN